MRCCVIDVAVDGPGEAAGRGAGRGAGADQVAELAAWQVVIFGVGVVAVAFGDGVEGEVEAAEEHG